MIAIANYTRSKHREMRLPRRLVYIVNRRTVVDQATEVVLRLRERLLHPPEECKQALVDLRHGLSILSGGDTGDALAIGAGRHCGLGVLAAEVERIS